MEKLRISKPETLTNFAAEDLLTKDVKDWAETNDVISSFGVNREKAWKYYRKEVK